MKGKKKYIFIIFIFSIFIIIIGSLDGYIKGHDTNFHIANISAITEKISIENMLVQEPLNHIAKEFGYGTRFFYPPLPHLLASAISKVVDNVIIGMRLTEWLCLLLSGITFFCLISKILSKVSR